MPSYEIIKINEDGKLEVPSEAAQELGVFEGGYFLLEVSPEIKEARLEHIALPGKDLVEIELVVKDEPGVLATISGIFAQYDVNILFNESEEISDKEAVLISIVDTSKMNVSIDELKEALSKRDEVQDILVKHID